MEEEPGKKGRIVYILVGNPEELDMQTAMSRLKEAGIVPRIAYGDHNAPGARMPALIVGLSCLYLEDICRFAARAKSNREKEAASYSI